MGDRYGYRPFPAKVPKQEFEMFLEVGLQHEIDTTLLSKWYKCDTNSIEVVYQLQPITDHFPNYISRDLELRAKDREGWWQEFQAIQKSFWLLVEAALQSKKMSMNRGHVYLQSGM